MQVKLRLSTTSLYPILNMEDQHSLIQNSTSFSQLIHSKDFSLVMSKLQRLKQNRIPFNTQASIKTCNGLLPFSMESYIEENFIYVTLSNEKSHLSDF